MTALTSDQLPALKKEFDNDPQNVGYGTWRSGTSATQPDTTLAQINAPAPGLIMERAIGETVSWTDCEQVIDFDDLLMMTPQQIAVVGYLKAAPPLDPHSAMFRDLVRASFPSSSRSRGLLLNLIYRAASRTEQLFGIGYAVTEENVDAAAALT